MTARATVFNKVPFSSEADSTWIAAKWSFNVVNVHVKRQLASTGKSLSTYATLCLSLVPVHNNVENVS